ncbi:MAG: hypothetical protein AB1498_05615 [bacterium]
MKKRFLPVFCILINAIFYLVILSPFIKAEETVSGIYKGEFFSFIETGKKSTSEDYKEEDSDADYTYANYQVKFRQDPIKRAGCDLSFFAYRKDYDTSDALDNKSRIFKAKWFYYLQKQKEKSLKFDIKMQYKEKGYYESIESEFSQFMISPSLEFRKKDIYTLDFSSGFNKYDYPGDDKKGQLKYSGKLDLCRYFLEKKLILSGDYGIEHLDHKQEGRDRTKHNLSAGLDYVFAKPYIHEIETKIKWGKRDTKDEDERDEDSDYEYRRYKAKSFHKINNRLNTGLKYEFFKKDYNVINLDHKGFYIENGYDYEVRDDMKKRIWLNFDMGRKDTIYSERTGNDYRKITANIKLNYNRKGNWKTSLGFEGNFYKYRNFDNDKKRYYARWSGEKVLLKNKLNVSADFKYRFTNYVNELDDEQESLRLGTSYEF